MHCYPKPKEEEWNVYNAKNIPVPGDGLFMYHFVHAANDPDWMKYRHECGMAIHSEREKADEVWAQALKRQFIAFLISKEK